MGFTVYEYELLYDIRNSYLSPPPPPLILTWVFLLMYVMVRLAVELSATDITDERM